LCGKRPGDHQWTYHLRQVLDPFLHVQIHVPPSPQPRHRTIAPTSVQPAYQYLSAVILYLPIDLPLKAANNTSAIVIPIKKSLTMTNCHHNFNRVFLLTTAQCSAQFMPQFNIQIIQ
jgi:hypothetical protein